MVSEMMTAASLPPLKCEAEHNYVAFFLTLSCNLKCPYCINLHDNSYQQVRGRALLGVDDWIRAANRLVLRDDLPLTLQGGEPTLHKGFYRFVNEVRPEIQMDLMTNLTFDVERFIAEVPVSRFNREAPYAAIRVSYHPGQNKADELMRKARRLLEAGFKVGVYGILHPEESIRSHILDTQEMFQAAGLDFRVKEFLGEHDGKMYGTFKYPGSVAGDIMQECECRTSELIVDPGGLVYRCHADRGALSAAGASPAPRPHRSGDSARETHRRG